MDAPAYWGVAGRPVSHSITPKLFSIVGGAMGLVQAEQIFVEASGDEEFYSKVEMLEGDLWLSCTTPLKHSPHSKLGVKGPQGVNAINQLMRSKGVWKGASTRWNRLRFGLQAHRCRAIWFDSQNQRGRLHCSIHRCRMVVRGRLDNPRKRTQGTRKRTLGLLHIGVREC